MFRSFGLPEFLVVLPIFAIVGAIPFFRISKRLGYSAWWGLVNLLPFGTIIWAYYVAFSKWPRDSSPN